MSKQSLLKAANTVLVLIDVQGKIAQVMYDKETLFKNLQKLIRGIQVLEVPIIVTEQYPQGLGPTVPEIAQLFKNFKPIAKTSFSSCGDENFMKEFKALNRKQVLIAGIEMHVCVYQTALELLNAGYEVQIVADAVSSRAEENIKIALERLRDAGAALTSTEMVLFELMQKAQGPKFKEISQIVK